MVKIDIICRLLLLSDVINNATNFGISPSGKFIIIDFRPPIMLLGYVSTSANTYQISQIYQNWLSGNSEYNYSDTTVKNIFKEPNTKLKKERALLALDDLSDFGQCVYDSYDKIMNTIQDLKFEEKDLIDLENYRNGIIFNYNTLKQGINSME